MRAPTGPLVVIGVGNVLLGDDAVGVRVVEALEVAAQADPGILPPTRGSWTAAPSAWTSWAACGGPAG